MCIRDICESNLEDFGKQNSTFLFRSGYGKLLILFDKPDFGGISVSTIASAGVCFAFLKPVYLDILYLLVPSVARIFNF